MGDTEAVGSAQRSAATKRRNATAVKGEADAIAAVRAADRLQEKATAARASADKAAGTKNEPKLVAGAEKAEQAAKDARDAAIGAELKTETLRSQVDEKTATFSGESRPLRLAARSSFPGR